VKNIAILFFLVSFVLTSGCATIVSKSEWPVQIASTPDGADVSITDIRDGKKVFTAKTPTSVVLTAKGGFFKGKIYRVDVVKEGYATQSTEIKSALNGWYIGNILFGGVIGLLIVDPASGAMWTLDNRDINLILEKKMANAPTDQGSFSIDNHIEGTS
jgi:uncharacterized protein YceK